jgi:hypothetical protein
VLVADLRKLADLVKIPVILMRGTVGQEDPMQQIGLEMRIITLVNQKSPIDLVYLR